MTTIAYRDGVMAADSLSTSDGIAMGTVAKAIRREDGAMCGAAGSTSLIRALLAWFENGEGGDKPDLKDNGAQALIIRPTGSTEWHDEFGFHVISAPFFAIGSGRDVALGAMAAGASAEEAVEHAIRFDINSGGPIVVVRGNP